MRRPSLARWLKRHILHLTGGSAFSMRRAAAAAQGNAPRAAAPLLLLAVEEGRLASLMGFVYREDVRQSFTEAAQALEGTDLERAALSGVPIAGLTREYQKHLDSFRADYFAPETRAESKRIRLVRSRALQLEKGVPTSQVCAVLGLNRGNVNDYLKNGSLEKVSLENADAIMKYLAAL